MDSANAFVGQRTPPTVEEVLEALGPTASAWSELVGWLAQEHGVEDAEWKSYSPKFGWSCKLKLKNRTILHLGPQRGNFLVMVIFGDRALKAARESDLSKGLRKALDEAPRYTEGTGLRILVKSPRDLAGIKKLAVIKLAY
jgi:hypothetical protein